MSRHRDTVMTVGPLYSQEILPLVGENGRVKVFRHALSLDEVRTISRICMLIGRLSTLSPLYSTPLADIRCVAYSVESCSVQVCIISLSLILLRQFGLILPHKNSLILPHKNNLVLPHKNSLVLPHKNSLVLLCKNSPVLLARKRRHLRCRKARGGIHRMP